MTSIKRTPRTILPGLALLLMLSACGGNDNVGPASAGAAPCDRACLLGFVDQYVAALVAHDPSRAPFAAAARFTENAQVLALGDALWGTASAAPGSYQIKVADTQSGNAGFYLLMQESGSPIWLSGRLKVENRLITELETVVIRQGAGFGNFELSTPDPEWSTVVAAAERNTRAQLFDIADRYFESLERNLVDYVPFDDSCNRIENGVKTANNPDVGGAGDGPGVGALSCRENINSGMWGYITRIAPRRYLVADEERGIAMGVFMFHQDGSVPSVNIAGYGEYQYSGATRRPFTTVIPEMFKIKNGRIYRIEATMASIPYKSASGW
ncbi:MAG: hypothetical protein RQ899_10480 [Pseudomonadales bacterium]|nr:hypothetical protein [Pseudomonadales bacterium]